MATSAPAWFGHSMAPVEPYAKVGKALVSSGNVHTHTVLERSIAGGGTENVSGLSQMNTGTTLSSYKPSFGEPRRENRRKGYHRDLDWNGPRKASTQGEVSTNNGRVHVLSSVPDVPDYGPGSSGMFTNGFKTRSVTYPQTYSQGKDHVWERKEDMPEVFKDEIKTRELYQETISKDAKARERKKERERAETHKQYDVTLSNNRPQVKKQDHKRVMLDTQLKRHEEGISGDTDMTGWTGRQGNGAARRNPDGSLNAKIQPDAETHMANTKSSTSSQHFDPEYRTSMRRYRQTLDEQVGEIRVKRDQERARSAERITLDDGGVKNFGKPGFGGAWRNDDGSTRTIVPRKRKPTNKQLATELKDQRKAQRDMRKQEHKDAVFSDEAYNPWGMHDRNKNASHVRHKNNTESGQPVQGASLDSTKVFGTAGGGAPSYNLTGDGRKVLDGSRGIDATEARVEAEARAKGESVFGKAGAGAPIRDEHGEINTRTRGRAVRDKDETTGFRSDPVFREGMKVLAEHQSHALREKGQARIDRKTADRLADTDMMLSLKLEDDSVKAKTKIAAYTGDRRFVKPGNMKDLSPELAYTPMVPKDIAGLTSQIEEKRDRARREKSIQLKEEVTHNTAADFSSVNTHRVEARMRQQQHRKNQHPILHTEKKTTDPATKKALADDLDHRIRERAVVKKRNRARKKKEELEHSKASDRIFAPQPRPRRMPRDPNDYEYKMLVPRSSNLV